MAAASLDPLPARRERVQKALSELTTKRDLLVNCTTEWTELENHFVELEKAIQARHQELVEKEKAFEAKTSETNQALDKREEAISVRERTSLARVQEQKDAAISSILEEKRKAEGRPRKDSETAAAAKVEASSAPNGSAPQAMDVDTASTKPGNATPSNGAIKDATSNQGKSASEVKVRPQLKSLCENMDGEGLRKYIVDHRKDVNALRNELPSALQIAIDPSRLVLKALEGYHLLELHPSQAKETGASANRRACISLLECLVQVLADPVLGVDHPVVPSNIKESAKEMANTWRSKMDNKKDTGNDNALDAQAFLQLLATFGIASEFSDDELCNLVSTISRRKQTPALCRSLGLTEKIPGLVEKLAKEGKQIEALAFAHAFGIMDKVQPVPMLKAYLKEARKAAQALAKNAPSLAAAHNDSTMKELSALKAVTKAVLEYKLESQYPTESLQKRVEQLEKSKADRKRAATAVKAQAKKPRQTGVPAAGYGGSSAHAGAASVAERGYYRPSDRGQYIGTSATSYGGVSSLTSFDGRPQAGYTSMYETRKRSPVSLSSSYLYSADGLGSSLHGPISGYSNPSTSYGSAYHYGNGLAASSAAYPSYLR